MVDVALLAAGGECITAAARARVVAGFAAGDNPVVSIVFVFAVFALDFIFCFAVGCRLPLHVLRGVGSAAGQGFDMVNDVAWAWAVVVAVGWAWVFALKGVFGGLTAYPGFGAGG